jgi:outer membrane receptor protein involved in Fe transport
MVVWRRLVLPGALFPVLLVASLGATTAHAQSSAGAVKGRVLDAATGQPLGGVTIVATSPSLQGSQSELTDDLGVYEINNLPPGLYEIVFYYGDIKVRKPEVRVVIGATTPVHLKLDTGQAGGEVITIVQKAPAIDSGSTKQGVKLDQEYLQNIPQRGRNFEDTLGAAAGAQDDLFGTSFSGSTSIENNYIIDGLNTTGLTYGQVGTSLLTNFVEEMEIITGGYDAEYGRSTGGVVSVITKSGSNNIRGSVWGSLESGYLSLSPESPFVAGSAIGQDEQLLYDTDFGFEIGGPIIPDRIWFYVGFAPVLHSERITRIVSTQVDREINDHDYAASADGDGNPATNNNVGCELSQTCEGDRFPDIDPATGAPRFEEIDRNTFNVDTSVYQFTGKLNFAVSPDHQGSIGVNGATYSAVDLVTLEGTPTGGLTRGEGLTTDTSVRWVSKFDKNRTEVDVVPGWHRADTEVNPYTDTLPDSPMVRVMDTPMTEVQETTLGIVGRNRDKRESDEVLRFCTDDDPFVADPFRTIENCPVTSYRWDAPGAIGERTEERLAGKISATRRFRLFGHHQIKAGLDGEQNQLTDYRGWTGGSYNVGHYGTWDITRYARIGAGDDVCGIADYETGETIPCEHLDLLGVHGETISWAGYLQDKWDILPNLRISAGIRYEEQILRNADEVVGTPDDINGGVKGKNAMVLSELWAPRLGVVYDWTKEGRSKIYGSYGRFYENVPMDINNRAFGGETFYITNYDWASHCGAWGDTPTDATPRTPSDPNACPTRAQDLWSNNYDYYYGAGSTYIAPGLQAQRMDEISIGTEYEPIEDVTVGVAYQNRNMNRVIEDVSVDGMNTYIVANPGEFDAGAEADLVAQIEAMPEGDERAALEKRLDDFLTFTAKKRFSNNFFVQGAYTYSKLEGNYPGLFSDDNQFLAANITSQYDLIELLGNRQGPLPHDRPHLVKLDGYYRFDLKAAGQIIAGGSLRGQSGKPVNVLGSHLVYGGSEVHILPRGSGGRTEFLTQADLRLGWSRPLGRGTVLSVSLDFLNVFDSSTETNIDQNYTQDNVNPIIGGEIEDLKYLKRFNADGSEGQQAELATRLQNWGNSISYQQPLTMRLGAQLTF